MHQLLTVVTVLTKIIFIQLLSKQKIINCDKKENNEPDSYVNVLFNFEKTILPFLSHFLASYSPLSRDPRFLNSIPSQPEVTPLPEVAAFQI